MKPAKEITPPKDRQIKVVANVIVHEDAFCSVETYEGFAIWSEQAQDWLDEHGMSIRCYYESEINILEWDYVEGSAFVLVSDWNRVKPRRVGPPRPIRPGLPAPEWHTAVALDERREINWDTWYAFRKQLEDIRDIDLVRMAESHDQWFTFACDWRAMSPVRPGAFSDEQWRKQEKSAYEVRDALNLEMMRRFRAATLKRSQAGRRAGRRAA